MALPSCFLLLFVVAVPLGSLVGLSSAREKLNRTRFPPGFVFGTASSAYQYEGAISDGGRGLSIWDTFTHKHPEMIANGSNGDVAIDSYHRYKEDVNIMKDMGLDAYRFSISWSRILPNGSLSMGINKEGVQYYNNLIDELISNGLTPFVTLFHWDVPQGLEDQYGGFLNRRIVDDFRRYAKICFREFGDRVKHWITFNEPWSFSDLGYSTGKFAPGRCSAWISGSCRIGDSSREPYIVAHHQLLAHAEATKLYRDKYQELQKGKIGIALAIIWMIPYTDSNSDREATQRGMDFMYGWFMDPLTQGDYPYNMKALVGDRLPKFTSKESKMINGSFDFIGLNYYTTSYAFSIPKSKEAKTSYNRDASTNLTSERNGIPIGPKAGSNWLYIYPRGIRHLLRYTKTKYNNPVIYITENGIDEVVNETLSLEEALKDPARISFYKQHLHYVQRSVREGVDVRGYFAWSLLDNFEWADGYTVRFGINYVDYNNGLKRYPKSSALWFRRFLRS